jgi:hypothetical protein
VFLAKLLRAFVRRIRDGNDLNLWMFRESRQMPSTNDIARSDNPNTQFVIIFVHGLREMLILQSLLVLVRAKFDRLRHLRVQP